MSLLVVAGPTASGKSRLGIELALAIGGEIISADAFAIYRGMDIGTDCPALEDRSGVPHHLVDRLDPNERCSAGDWAQEAETAVAEIERRGAQVIVVGGSGLYLQALLFGLFPDPGHDPELRAELLRRWQEDPEPLRSHLEQIDPVSAASIGPADYPRILRAIEVHQRLGRPLSELKAEHRSRARRPALVIVLKRPRAELYARIDARVEEMFESGLMAEVKALFDLGFDPSHPAFRAIGYREIADHLAGGIGLDEARQRTQQATRRLAKRQLGWLRAGKLGRVVSVEADEHSFDTAIGAWRAHLRDERTT